MDNLLVRSLSELVFDVPMLGLYFAGIATAVIFLRRYPLQSWLVLIAVVLMVVVNVAGAIVRNYLMIAAEQYGWSQQEIFTNVAVAGIAGNMVFTAAVGLLLIAVFSERLLSAPVSPRQLSQSTVSSDTRYAGFWKRFAAVLLDSLLVNAAAVIITGIVVLPLVLGMELIGKPSMVAVLGTSTAILSGVGAWIYFAAMESSPPQATLGKMALGIIVVDEALNRISFMRASGRFFGKSISAFILFIGFIMAAFSEKKQALHDILAGCLVINKLEG